MKKIKALFVIVFGVLGLCISSIPLFIGFVSFLPHFKLEFSLIKLLPFVIIVGGIWCLFLWIFIDGVRKFRSEM